MNTALPASDSLSVSGALYEMFTPEIEQELLPKSAFLGVSLPMDVVKEGVAWVWGLHARVFNAASRGNEKIATARLMAMHICSRWELGNLASVAEAFNRKDHGTVYHANKVTPLSLLQSEEYRAKYVLCLRRISILCFERTSIPRDLPAPAAPSPLRLQLAVT